MSSVHVHKIHLELNPIKVTFFQANIYGTICTFKLQYSFLNSPDQKFKVSA